MERIDPRWWGKQIQPRDRSALMLVLAISIGMVAILGFVLF